MYQSCNSKVIHIGIVDKSSFNPFLILGIYGPDRIYTNRYTVDLRKMRHLNGVTVL